MSQGLSIYQTWTWDAAKLRKHMHAFIMAVNQCHFTFCLLEHLTHPHAKIWMLWIAFLLRVDVDLT